MIEKVQSKIVGSSTGSAEGKANPREKHLSDPGRNYLIMLGGLLLFAFVVRAWELGRDSIWFDEGVSVGIAHLSWRDFFLAWRVEVNSGLYYFFVRMLLPFGQSEVFLRLTSVVTGVAAIAAFAEFVRRTLGRSRALITAFFLSVNVSACFYAREIRGYAMLLLLISLAWLALERCLRDGRQRWFAIWAILWVAAMYVHMFSVMVLVGQLLAAPFATEFRGRIQPFTRSLVWIAIGYFPMAMMIYYSNRQQIGWVWPNSLKASFQFFLELFGNSAWLLGISAALFVGTCTMFALAVLRRRSHEERFGLAVAVIGTVVPITLLALLSIVQPAFIARYAAQVVPTLALACAIAVSALPRKSWIPILVLLGALSLNAFRRFDLEPPVYEQRNDYRSAVAYIAAHAQPGDVIATWGPQSRYAVEYYARLQHANPFPSFVFPGTEDSAVQAEVASYPSVQYLDSISAQHKHIWFLFDRNVPYKQAGIIPHFFLRRLGLGHRTVSETQYRHARLFEFGPE